MKPWVNRINKDIESFFAEPITKYVIIITSIVSILLIAQAWIDGTTTNGRFLSSADKQLAINFVEWFGVLYGFLLPTILVRVWEQFDEIDNVLDREADSIKSLMGDLLLLDPKYEPFKKKVLCSLFEYSKNVVRFIDGKIPLAREKKNGDQILKKIRGYYIGVFRKKDVEIEGSDVLKNELLTQLNNIIDYRGDRISLSTKRLFESLNFIAVITSIIWLVPFYFLHFQNQQSGKELQLGMFGWLLVIFVTFLIIIILSIIDDLDKPFDGFWRVNISSWYDLVIDIKSEYKKTLSDDTDLQRAKKKKPTRKKIKLTESISSRSSVQPQIDVLITKNQEKSTNPQEAQPLKDEQ